jgi:putative nucleotidyltransferase with HDIG domain
LELDEKRTRELKESRVKEAGPVYNTWSVSKNELIVEKGTRVNERHIAQIIQMHNIFTKGKPVLFFIGVVLLFLLLGLIGAIYLNFIHRTNLLHYTKKLSIILLCLLFIIIVADFVIRLPQPSYFIPLASMSMLIILLVDFNSAFLATILMSILVGVLTGGKIEITFALLVGSIVGMYKVRNARRRADILRAGLWVGAAKFVAIICMGFVNGVELRAILNDGFWGIASGIVAGFVVMGLLPLFEHGFKVATNISLLELSDLNHPLLKTLSLEAPGTYHHAIMVGNLAEAACDAIDANSLLARVGAYYHDIGKIQKAEYFNENEMGTGSRHKSLTPSMSALIIAKHVKDGVDVAQKYKINTAVVDFIKQHHGDSLISFFYQKALEKAEKDQKVEEEDFRYPGPRPQTKETAIVLLADAVEAASRSLEDPTPSSVRNLVRKIVNNKFIDGQLDECDLTLKDMHNIADSFVRVLNGIYHTRSSYPEGKKNTSEGTRTNGDQNKSGKQKPKKKN